MPHAGLHWLAVCRRPGSGHGSRRHRLPTLVPSIRCTGTCFRALCCCDQGNLVGWMITRVC